MITRAVTIDTKRDSQIVKNNGVAEMSLFKSQGTENLH